MPTNPVNIKVLIAAGARVPDAIKAALEGGPSGFASRHKLPRSHVSRCIHGKQKHERVRRLLAPELSVEREWLDEVLDALGKR